MGVITKLPDRVANQIAAGEVVERPVAVIKELVENALDAGAGQIEIQFEKGGKALMRVSDDGIGMERDDAILALERHATSKIQQVDDILNIISFGFRGEALPSIASVSNFTLRTRQRENSIGTEIIVNGGKDMIVRDCGMSPGTDVIVGQLFNTVPARRKFLKTEKTEAAHIMQMCRLLAIANPGVGFTLTEDGREVFRSPKCAGLKERLGEIYTRQRAAGLLEVDKTVSNYRVRGLIGPGREGRTSRSEMHVFVNNRPVESRLLTYALIESYHPYLPRGRYPEAFIFVDVPPQSVDVNVHPAKREIRFRDESHVRRIVMEAVSERLQEAGRKTILNMERVAPLPNRNIGNTPIESSENSATKADKNKIPLPHIRPSAIPQKGVEHDPRGGDDRVVAGQSEGSAEAEKPQVDGNREPGEETPGKFDTQGGMADWRFIGVYGKGYGLFENTEGLATVNPKAAQDRIQYEKITTQLRNEAVEIQAMLFPIMLDLSPIEASLLAEEGELFRKVGFELEPFGRNLFRMRGYPRWFEPEHAERFVRDLLQKLRERGIRTQDSESVWKEVARLAIYRISPKQKLSGADDWTALIDLLFQCDNPLIDPRGRAIIHEWRHGEIERYFSS